MLTFFLSSAAVPCLLLLAIERPCRDLLALTPPTTLDFLLRSLESLMRCELASRVLKQSHVPVAPSSRGFCPIIAPHSMLISRDKVLRRSNAVLKQDFNNELIYLRRLRSTKSISNLTRSFSILFKPSWVTASRQVLTPGQQRPSKQRPYSAQQRLPLLIRRRKTPPWQPT